MQLLSHWRRRLANWIDPPAVLVVKRRRVSVKTRRTPYTGDQSGTRQEIIRLLDLWGPATRKQLQERMNVTTAGIHLPLMVRVGLVRVQPGTWPYVYELVRYGPVDSRSSETENAS